MKFFKPEDFEKLYENNNYSANYSDLANFANEKLEKESIRYEADFNIIGCNKFFVKEPGIYILTQKEKCKHPEEKIRQMNYIEPNYGYNTGLRIEDILFKCECGSIVRPQKFYEVEK